MLNTVVERCLCRIPIKEQNDLEDWVGGAVCANATSRYLFSNFGRPTPKLCTANEWIVSAASGLVLLRLLVITFRVVRSAG